MEDSSMSDAIQIPKHRARAFKANIYHGVQQTQTSISSMVRMESHDSAKSVSYDSYKPTVVNRRTERNQKTKIVSTDRERRTVRAYWYDHAVLIDKIDTAEQIHMPQNPLTMAAIYAFNRKKDEIVYEAGLGDSYLGENGETAIALPDKQKIVAFDGTSTTASSLNIATLARMKRMFWDNEVGVDSGMTPGAMFNIACTGAQIEQLLNDTTITSQDFNSIRALVRGDVDTFMGFKFHIFNGVKRDDAPVVFNPLNGQLEAGAAGSTTEAYDRCLVWYNDGLLLSMGQDIRVDIGVRRDLSLSTQAYLDMHLGALRMEEEKVIELIAKAV